MPAPRAARLLQCSSLTPVSSFLQPDRNNLLQLRVHLYHCQDPFERGRSFDRPLFIIWQYDMTAMNGCTYGLYSYGLYSYGLYSYCPYVMIADRYQYAMIAGMLCDLCLVYA